MGGGAVSPGRAVHFRNPKAPLPPAEAGRTAAQDLIAEVRSGSIPRPIHQPPQVGYDEWGFWTKSAVVCHHFPVCAAAHFGIFF